MNKKLLTLSIAICATFAVFISCNTDEFLDRPAQGQLDASVLSSTDGLELLLVGAYSQLDGWSGWDVGAPWQSSGTNWVYGDVMADNSYKGSDAGDQAEITDFERYTISPTNAYNVARWRAIYDGVARTNDVIRVAQTETAAKLGAAFLDQVVAEARFLRGYYHFEAVRLWDNVPYVDESNVDGLVENTGSPWAQIEADFQFAADKLPVNARNGQPGRATKHAANAMLAKAKLAQGNYSAALPLLNGIISSGKYSLVSNFHDNFKADTDNNKESVFEMQASINDGSGEGANGVYGNILNFPYTGGPGACCGFYQPTQNLVNAYKTVGGLPMLTDFNTVDVKNDEGLLSSDPFTPYTGELDPRLDWTVGRRGIPYLDWGPHPGKNWIRDQGYAGPYSPIKNVYYAAEEKINSNAGGWGGGTVANNYRIIRYADVLLMAAECEVEVGSISKALEYVNAVRTRAANPAGFVKKSDGSNAANYVISTYPSFASQGAARDAVRFERRLELAMEGHRWYDLKRWGTVATVLNNYISTESKKRSYLAGATFQSKNVRLPIPQVPIDQSKGTLKQNEGF